MLKRSGLLLSASTDGDRLISPYLFEHVSFFDYMLFVTTDKTLLAYSSFTISNNNSLLEIKEKQRDIFQLDFAKRNISLPKFILLLSEQFPIFFIDINDNYISSTILEKFSVELLFNLSGIELKKALLYKTKNGIVDFNVRKDVYGNAFFRAYLLTPFYNEAPLIKEKIFSEVENTEVQSGYFELTKQILQDCLDNCLEIKFQQRWELPI
ncbi:MAG: hypothetical protein ACK4PR_09220 [Gammaproteobacteria bacterium]